MEAQKEKLQDYQITRTEHLNSMNLELQIEQQKKAQTEAKRRAGRHYEQQLLIANYREEKRKAEELLLMQPLSGNNMQEELEYDEGTLLGNETQRVGVMQNTVELSHGANTETLVNTVATDHSRQKKVTATAFPSSSVKKHDRAKYISQNQKSQEYEKV